MELNIGRYCNRRIVCSCGREHYCPIEHVEISRGALQHLPQLLEGYRRIVLVADQNTDAACGRGVWALLGARVQRYLIYHRTGMLVPDERAVAELENALSPDTDFIVGVGSGVINDICKYVSFGRGLEYAIVATAPSMDGYASSGAAMITNGMKVTYTTHPPRMIVGDVKVLRKAPIEMIRSGYGDIIGKYSSLNDWRLSALMNGEHFCREIYDLVMQVTDSIRDSAEAIVRRQEQAIADLTQALVLIGITLSLLGSTRPGSGSEHHLSHFFEIVGLVRHEPHFTHGTDVAYATVVTAGMREEIAALPEPAFDREDDAARQAAWKRVYGPLAGEVEALQEEAGWYGRDLRPEYRARWQQIRQILADCPTADACRDMLTLAGFSLPAFEKMYGRQKIRDAMLYGKDLKNRYSVLWLYYELFSGRKPA